MSTTLTNSVTAKVFAVVAGVAIALSFAFAPVSSVQAAGLTDGQIQSILDLLSSFGADSATISNVNAALNGQATSGTGSTGSSCGFTQSFNVGATGAEVMEIQKFLNGKGFTIAATGAGSAGNETTYYGSLTAAAVTAFQNAYAADILAPVGLTSGTGYWGPSTMAKANMMCGGSSNNNDDSSNNSNDGTLSGGAGSVSEYKKSSEWNQEEVGEDEDDVTVVGLEIEADDNSDLEIKAIKVDFDDEGTANNSADLDKYVADVTVWFDGEKVAEEDASEFDDDNNYGKTVTLDSGVIVEAGERITLQIAVSGISNLDSSDAGDSWNVDVESVRWRDAQGTVISEDPSISETKFTVETFATATDVEFKISGGDTSINDAHVISVATTTATDNVDVFSFNVKINGNSDVFVDDLTVEATVTGAGQLDELADQAHLYMDGEKVDSVTVPTDDETVTFDDLDLDLEAGNTYEFVVALDFLAVNGALDEGDTVLFTIGETETDGSTTLTDIRDENGDQLADADKTGSATSEASVVYANAPQISNVSSSVVVSDVSDTLVDVKGDYTIQFDVTAGDADLYIASSTASTSADTKGVEWATKGNTFVGSGSSDFSMVGGSLTASSAYKVKAGTTETFKLVVSLDNRAPSAGFFGIEVDSINFADADDTNFAATAAYLGTNANYTTLSIGLDDLETTNVNLN